MRILLFVLCLSLSTLLQSCSVNKCTCKSHVKNFNFIEPRYKIYSFSTGKYETIKKYTDFDSIPMERINKHIFIILKCTDVKLTLPSASLDFGLTTYQVENYRKWILDNCEEEYKRYYEPPSNRYVYTPYRTVKRRKRHDKQRDVIIKTKESRSLRSLFIRKETNKK